MRNSRTLTIIGIVAVITMAAVAVILSGRDNPTTPAGSNIQMNPTAKSDIIVDYISLNNTASSATVIGCEDGLIPRTVSVEGSSDLANVYKHVLSLPELEEPGITNPLSRSSLTFQNAHLEGDTAYIDLTGEIISTDSCDRARIRAQLERPAQQNAGVMFTVVRINGFLLEDLF